MKPITIKRNGEVVVNDKINGGRIKNILIAVENNKHMCQFINKNNDDATLKRIEKFLKIGGQINEISEKDIPIVEEIRKLPSPPTPISPIVQKEPMTQSTIPQPKGIWLFFHRGDLAGLSQIGGASKATKFFRKVGRELKKVGKEINKVERIFKPITRTDIPLYSIKSGEPIVPYITIGKEKRSDGEYDVVTCSMYYTENIAIGIGWELKPREKKLGYHPYDMEFVSIYYQNGVPKKVFMSEHSVGSGEGAWRNYNECEFRDGYLVVYVARNSHANYFTSGNQPRIFGLASDVTESDGPNKAFKFSEMTPSYDWNSGTGIKLYSGLRPSPPDTSLSKKERIVRFK